MNLNQLVFVIILAGQMVDGHVHKAHHGGVIAHFDRKHVEVVVGEGLVTVWLLNEKERVIPPKGIRGQVRLVLEKSVDGGTKTQTVVLQKVADHLEASADVQEADTVTGTLEFRLKGRVTKAAFRWTPLDARKRLDDSLDQEGLYIGPSQ